MLFSPLAVKFRMISENICVSLKREGPEIFKFLNYFGGKNLTPLEGEGGD